MTAKLTEAQRSYLEAMDGNGLPALAVRRGTSSECVRRLVAAGLAAASFDGDDTKYRITPAGRKALDGDRG